MRWASIDIGTNTLRLLIADIDNKIPKRRDKKLKPIIVKRIITRLGGDYTEQGGIDREAKERTIGALKIFSEKIKEYHVKQVTAVATSVVRRARNREEFLKNVFEQTGIKVDIISGDEEARLALLGVLSVIRVGTDFISQRRTVSRCLVIDIGGGSTEFIAVDSGKIIGAWSMEMGVVHLTEKYIKTDPPTRSELDAMETEIERIICDLRSTIYDLVFFNPKSEIRNSESEIFVGTAGTITTLAAIDQKLEKYESDKINNYILSYEAIKKIYHHLASLPLEQREEILSLEKGREDIIIPGAAIVLKAMKMFGFDKMTVSDAGLLEGILLDKIPDC